MKKGDKIDLGNGFYFKIVSENQSKIIYRIFNS